MRHTLWCQSAHLVLTTAAAARHALARPGSLRSVANGVGWCVLRLPAIDNALQVLGTMQVLLKLCNVATGVTPS